MLAKFLIFDVLEEQIFKEKGLQAPDLVFTLGYKLDEDYQKERFSLLNNKQIMVVIHFLENKVNDIIAQHKQYAQNYNFTANTVFSDESYIELDAAIQKWKQKLK